MENKIINPMGTKDTKEKPFISEPPIFVNLMPKLSY